MKGMSINIYYQSNYYYKILLQNIWRNKSSRAFSYYIFKQLLTWRFIS